MAAGRAGGAVDGLVYGGWRAAVMALGGSVFEEEDSAFEEGDDLGCLWAGDLVIDIGGTLYESAEALLHGSARMVACVAWIAWPFALDEDEVVGLLAVEGGKLVFMAWIKDGHGLVLRLLVEE